MGLSTHLALIRRRNDATQDLAGGVGNLLTAMSLAPLYAAQAADEAAAAEDKRRLTQSQIDLHQAGVGARMAETAIKQRELQDLQGRPDALRLMSASRAGVSVPEFEAALNERTHGAPAVGPSFLSEPIAGLGPSGRTTKFDSVISNLYAPAIATPADRLNWDQLAQAEGHRQDQDVLGQAVAAANAGNIPLANSLSAVRGKTQHMPFRNVGSTGLSINQETGAQTVANAVMNTLFQDEGKALIGQRNAAAGASGAAAGASTALRDLRREQTKGERAQTGMSELDLSAAQRGQPLPSSNRLSNGADSTNARFRNQVILKVMGSDDFQTMDPAKQQATIAAALKAAGLDPEPRARPIVLPPTGAGAGRGSAMPNAAEAAAAAAAAAAKPAARQLDFKAATAVRAQYHAGALTREQASAKLRQLGFE